VKDPSTTLLAFSACCLFILLGLAVIPYAGIQNDEALFANPLFQGTIPDYRIRTFHHDVPIMVMSYIGTLKTLLYWPIFRLFRPTALTVRLPVVLIGAITVWFFFLLVRKVSGPGVALLAAVLLATDPSFLLTDAFDWGPVAIEHLLVVVACLSLVHFNQVHFGPEDFAATVTPIDDRKCRWLVTGFFCLGLALWNKAIFLWALAGLVGALCVVCYPVVRKSLRRDWILAAAAAFVVGALPFIIYNIHKPNATLRSSAHLDFASAGGKFLQLRNTLDGSALFGFLVAEDWAERPKTANPVPRPIQGQAALWIRGHLGSHRSTGTLWALALAILAVPLWWRSRAARFSLVFMAVTWSLMAVTRGAGDSAHHAVLLWPFPQLFLAVAMGELRWRPVAALAAIALVGLNLLVINQYIAQFERDGAESGFTDAIYPLSTSLVEVPGQNVHFADWGMLNSIALLHQGRLQLRVASNPFMIDPIYDTDEQHLATLVSDPNGLFVGHVPARDVFPGVRARLDHAASKIGYRRDLIRTIPDSNGRPVFEVFRFVRF